VLLLALLMSLLPSVRLDYSALKFWDIVLGVAIFCACLTTWRSQDAMELAALLFLCSGTAIAVIGLLGMANPLPKLFEGPDLYHLLPYMVGLIQASTGADGLFNPNDVGGTVALFAPIAVALVFAGGWMTVVAIPAAAVLLTVLLLTQSRSALAGVAIALIVGAIWALGKRGALLVGVAIAVGLAVALAIIMATSASLWPRIGVAISSLISDDDPFHMSVSFAGRVELWMPALVMVTDMPFTGIGLNTFPVILQDFYPTNYYDPAYAAFIYSAPNIFLQTALDLGLVGLGALLWIITLAVRGGLAAARRGIERPLAIGLVLGLLAHGVYGLTNAATLAGNPSLALWAALGLLAALGVKVSTEEAGKQGQWTDGGQLGANRFRGQALPSRWVVQASLTLIISLIFAAPLTLNASRLFLHRSEAAQLVKDGFVSRVLETNLAVTTALAWGPYAARASAAQALLARVRGDTDSELAALQAAAKAGPWDPSLTHQLGALHLARGEWVSAADAWGQDKTVELFIRIGKAVAPADALTWYARAQAVDSTDWRPYVAATETLIETQRLDEASAILAKALLAVNKESVRSPDGAYTARLTLAERLVDPAAPLPAEIQASTSRVDAELFARASRLLESRSDIVGARYAARLAIQADPSHAAH
jgi:O-antigen ligase